MTTATLEQLDADIEQLRLVDQLSVSYTHLDVYKRQPLFTPMAISCRTRCISAVAQEQGRLAHVYASII